MGQFFRWSYSNYIFQAFCIFLKITVRKHRIGRIFNMVPWKKNKHMNLPFISRLKLWKQGRSTAMGLSQVGTVVPGMRVIVDQSHFLKHKQNKSFKHWYPLFKNNAKVPKMTKHVDIFLPSACLVSSVVCYHFCPALISLSCSSHKWGNPHSYCKLAPLPVKNCGTQPINPHLLLDVMTRESGRINYMCSCGDAGGSALVSPTQEQKRAL